MANEVFDDVWDAIEDKPEEALNMKLRSQLLMKLSEQVRSWNLSQKEAAKRLGITQPRLNKILKGKINDFSLDALVSLVSSAHLALKVEIYDAGELPAMA